MNETTNHKEPSAAQIAGSRCCKQFISFSGGVESTTMCVLFGNKADAIFCDTGFEPQAIYQQIDKVEQFVRKHIREDFKVHKIKANEKLHGKTFDNLPDYIRESMFYPSFQQRYCTRIFKIEPIDDFLEQFKDEGVELMIGLNVEEIDQRTGNHGNKKFIKYTYPLADNNITRNGCKIILSRVCLLPQLPVYSLRGGCIGCYYKSKREFVAMYFLSPDEFKFVEELETSIQGDRKTKQANMILQTMSLTDLRKECESMMFNANEMYQAAINDVTKCGVFCNR